MSETADDPGVLSAESLLEQPAAKRGPVVVRDGHFYTGDRRLRFWGVNLAFGANFPTHEQADALARRFSRFGINAVRFHHMDNQPFPNGIFADDRLDTFSAEAMDRLDYFIAVLKAKGVYADLNLHVSRNYSHYHRTPDGRDGPKLDKIVDLYDPDLIDSQKQYAKALLGHVNAYTHNAYSTEPAVAIVEINNENSLFMWGADRTIGSLTEPYAGELRKHWNQWLAKKYASRDALSAVWNQGLKPAGPELLRGTDFRSVEADWRAETHGGARMTAPKSSGEHAVQLIVTAVDGTAWHLQFNQSKLVLHKGELYTVTFNVRGDQKLPITVGVSQAHEPWRVIGGSKSITTTGEWKSCSFGFTPQADDDNARLSFMVGQQTGTIEIAEPSVHTGGGVGLAPGEDPMTGSVATQSDAGFGVRARAVDWYEFLQQTEQKYYVGMMDFLKSDVGVHCPITGTIGFGPSGTLTQSKMDFVDAHAYWQHPTFPHRQWDMSDWVVQNKAMVDHPATATLWQLATTRVAGKPFTVTEYQHAAPNEWEAECVPFIASYAAAQDWDGIFLFAYSHSPDFAKQKISTFFDIEGNPTKMPLMPMGARLFLDASSAGAAPAIVERSHDQLITGVPAHSADQGPFPIDVAHVTWQQMLRSPIAVDFDRSPPRVSDPREAARALPFEWTSDGDGTGRFSYATDRSAVFVGFSGAGKPINLGTSGVRIEKLDSPFATIIVHAEDSTKSLSTSDRLVLTAVARAQNSKMGWNQHHTSVGTNWGEPPAQIEVVSGTVTLAGRWRHAFALDSGGKRTAVDVAKPYGDRTVLSLGGTPALAYEIVR